MDSQQQQQQQQLAAPKFRPQLAAKPIKVAATGGFDNGGAAGAASENPWSVAFSKTLIRGSLSSSMGDGRQASGEKPYRIASKLGAEFVGTLLFVFIGSLSGLHSAPSSNPSVVPVAFGHGLAIFVLVASLGHVSGGHFNPAVSLGVALSGKMNPLVTVFYWISQVGGGFCGALLVRFVTSQQQYDSIAGGATIVPAGQIWYQLLLVEALLTMFLVQTVLTCAADTTTNLLAPLAIGMTVALDIFGGASLSGASMNPARSFGPCLVASLFVEKGPGMRLTDPIWSMHFVYWAGPFVGAVLAVVLYRSLLTRGESRVFP